MNPIFAEYEKESIFKVLNTGKCFFCSTCNSLTKIYFNVRNILMYLAEYMIFYKNSEKECARVSLEDLLVHGIGSPRPIHSFESLWCNCYLTGTV